MSHPNLKIYATYFVSAASVVIGHASYADDIISMDTLHREMMNVNNNSFTYNSDQYYLDIEINGVTETEPVSCFVNDNYVKVPIAILKKHGVIIESINDNKANNNPDYVNLNDYPWIEKTIDLTTQRLSLMIPADRFEERSVDADKSKQHKVDREHPGAYFNYDYTVNTYWPKSTKAISGLNELVYFNSYGVGSFSGILQDTFKKVPGGTPYKNAIRLETKWTYDHLESLSCVKIGDGISDPESWGASVRFGGIQWATNFNIQPNFTSFSLPSIRGQSAIPTVANFFVNDALATSKTVDRGPFLLNELPIVTGLGSVKVVTTDTLGRRQEVVMPYYAAPELLKPDLHKFSFEAGWLRYNYGVQSNTYKEAVGSLTYRRGILPVWTVGLHSEVTNPIKNIGLTNQILLGHIGVLSQSAAVSQSRRGGGSLLSLGFSRQANDMSFGTNNQITFNKFATVDMVGGGTKAKLTSQFFTGYSLKNLGSVGLSYTERRYSGMPNARYLTLNYQKQFKDKIAINMYASRSFENKLGDQVGLNLTWFIDNKSTASAITQLQRRNSSQGFDYHKNLIAEEGWGCDLIGGTGSHNHIEGRFNAQTKSNDFAFRAARNDTINGVELNGRGAIVTLGGVIKPSRYINDSFGMVKAEGLIGSTIYSNNQPVGKIDDDGILIVPQLNSYEENKLNIEIKELPPTHIIENTHISVVPGKRTGVVGSFKATKVKTVYFTLKDANGADCEPGTVLYEENTEQYCEVGMYGEVCIQIPYDLKKLKFKFVSSPSYDLAPDTEDSQIAKIDTKDDTAIQSALASFEIDMESDKGEFDDTENGLCHKGTYQCQL